MTRKYYSLCTIATGAKAESYKSKTDANGYLNENQLEK
jgi:hypothetical protein